jgi:flagellar hook assembly protein FlgD
VNAVRADVSSGGFRPGGTVYVEGTVPDKAESFLTRNFFNPDKAEAASVRVTVPENVKVRVRVFSVAGELVRKLAEQEVTAGLNNWSWDGRNDSGEAVANGVYYLQVEVDKEVKNLRVIVLRK